MTADREAQDLELWQQLREEEWRQEEEERYMQEWQESEADDH